MARTPKTPLAEAPVFPEVESKRGALGHAPLPTATSLGADVHTAVLTRSEFATMSAFIQDHCGIRFPPSKKAILEGRLRRRLRARGLTSFTAYCPLVLGPAASVEEVGHMIDEITTNKTEFLREAAHFDYLVKEALAGLGVVTTGGAEPTLSFWSAGCSSGEEIYTLAMVLEEARRAGARFRYDILGTDICSEVLQTAKRAIYEERAVSAVPLAWRHRYLLQSRQREEGLVRIAPALRARVKLGRLNLLTELPRRPTVDVVFCRNVLIYFDRPTQKRVLEGLCHSLAPGGYLFLGHSDSVTGLELPLTHLLPSIYRKRTEP